MIAMSELTPPDGPYRIAAAVYWDAGWRGVLPLPPRAKKDPPRGFTGNSGGWPSRADVQAWAETEKAANVALRLPNDVIGVDVDNYSSKQGAASLAAAETKWGPLPPTWTSTSRDDGTSGIRLYRVPEGLAWPGEIGPGIEIIRHAHRYALVWPSVHPEGRVYRWYTPDGVVSVTAVPTVDELPKLPGEWVAGLTGGQLADDIIKADLNDIEVSAWLARHGGGQQCEAVRMTVDRYISTRLTGTGSRHDAARDATARLMHMAAEGHTGVAAAVSEIGTAFRGAILADTNRAHDQGEWQRLYIGAVRLAAVDTTTDEPPRDPCIVPDVTILDVSTITVEDAAETTRRRALEAELNQQRIRRQARQLLDAEEAAAVFRVPPSRFTLVEELQIVDDPVAYTVEQVMPTGSNVLLTAQFKAGKTTLVNHLTRCLADQEEFLATLPVTPPDGRIGLFNYEVDERQYRRWLRELGIGAEPLVSVLNLRGYRLPLTSRHAEDWIVRWLAERDVSVWIVDPFARAFVGSGASENDNAEVGRFLDTLDVIKTRAGVSELILPTHTGRAEFEEGQERARGATRLDDWADVRWILTKDNDGVRYFSASGRDVEYPEVALAYDEEKRHLRIGGGSRKSARDANIDSAIVSCVETSPGMSKNQLETAVMEIVPSATQAVVRAAIGRAVRGRVIRTEGGIPKGTAIRCYLAGPTVLRPEFGEEGLL